MAKLTDSLAEHRDDLGLADIRSVAAPLGITAAADEAESQATSSFRKNVLRTRAARDYVSRVKEWQGHVTRLDFVLAADPFSLKAIDALAGRIQKALPAYLPDALQGSEVFFDGSTVSIRILPWSSKRILSAWRCLSRSSFLCSCGSSCGGS